MEEHAAPTVFGRCKKIELNNCHITSCAGAYSHSVLDTVHHYPSSYTPIPQASPNQYFAYDTGTLPPPAILRTVKCRKCRFGFASIVGLTILGLYIWARGRCSQ
ncbi:hypothetical protein BKA70DRAFT_1576573 [Coprinopsis sp. MPI-PUGE-AT-0042]|nr:hypothetical protein BKA70DRAFT_1576573 [Coprinopsis sp. MPI-PUGE-AT-0042]